MSDSPYGNPLIADISARKQGDDWLNRAFGQGRDDEVRFAVWAPAPPDALTIGQLATLARTVRNPALAAAGGYGQGNVLRIANTGDGPGPDITGLVRAGLMRCAGTVDDGEAVLYFATPAGEQALRDWRAAAQRGVTRGPDTTEDQRHTRRETTRGRAP